MAIGERIIRSKLDLSLAPSSLLRFETWEGNATTFQIGVFSGTAVESVSDVQSVNCRVMASRLSAVALADQTIAEHDHRPIRRTVKAIVNGYSVCCNNR